MNQFQKNIIKRMPQFSIEDFIYFTEEAENKVTELKIDKTCKIHNYFLDCTDIKYHQKSYCLLNCGLKCKQ